MKRTLAFLLALVCFCALGGCGTKAAPKVAIDYGNSTLYTREDMDGAIRLIRDEFATWEGCELHRIAYTSDDNCSAENLAWMNELAPSQNLAGDFTQCITFKSDFHSPKNGGGAWNADAVYTDWQWWLARTDGGEWQLLTWGY